MALYLYALGKEPEWTHYLVPIPDNLCNAQGIVNGVMYIFVLLCVLELLLALYLFEGARKVNYFLKLSEIKLPTNNYTPFALRLHFSSCESPRGKYLANNVRENKITFF